MVFNFSFRKNGIIPIIILVVLGCLEVRAQNQRDFINLSLNEGLSQSTIFSIYQDSKGFMWFGTRGGGLNRYNGYEFSVYMNHPDLDGSIRDNTIPVIFEDSHGTFWVGTSRGGINRFEMNTGRFYSYYLELKSDITNDQSLAVRCIYEDHSGNIWIGTNQKPAPVPGGLDWDLFQGPAPRREYTEETWDYNWHWYGWDYGTAESGNNGTHEMDVARWALQVDYPEHVFVDAQKGQFPDDGWEIKL